VASALAALAVAAPLAFVFGIEAEMEESIVVLAGHQYDIAAPASVTTAGAAARHVFLAPERKTAVAAIAGFDGNDYFIDE
jgi:hypothetical protein